MQSRVIALVIYVSQYGTLITHDRYVCSAGGEERLYFDVKVESQWQGKKWYK
jgi:hypothetical protein